MKNIAKLAKITLMLTLFMGWGMLANAQPPPPQHDQNTNQTTGNGGSAPIGSGMAILLGLSAAWGGKKVYVAYKVRE